MAHVSELPCDGDGICMVCKNRPSPEETLTCKTCATPWHVNCISSRPETLADTLQWECPDCSQASDLLPPPIDDEPVVAGESGGSGDLIAAIRAIESDRSLTEREKAKRRQELMCRGAGPSDGDDDANCRKGKETIDGNNDVLGIIDSSFNCSFCMQLPERPVTVGAFVCVIFYNFWFCLPK